MQGDLRLSTSTLLFSFQGRINRQPFWLANLAVIALTFVIFSTLFMVFELDLEDGAGVLIGGSLWLLVLYVPLLWIGLAVATKRLHDRSKSAWWLLLFYALPGVLDSAGDQVGGLGTVLSLASLAISVWAMIELGFLRGTPGPNAYGPDPLGGADAGEPVVQRPTRPSQE